MLFWQASWGESIDEHVTRPFNKRQEVSTSMPENNTCKSRLGFQTNEYVVYPTHGVGRIVAIEEQEIAGCKLELLVITFEKDKMTLRVPTAKAQAARMRKLSDD